MPTQSAPLPVCQHLEIAACLRRFYDSECVLLSRYGKIMRIVASNLQENPGIRAAFVSLSGGMQKARSKAQTSCYVLLITDRMAHRLQSFFVRAVHFDIS